MTPTVSDSDPMGTGDDTSSTRWPLEVLDEHRWAAYSLVAIVFLYVAGFGLGLLAEPSQVGATNPPLTNVVGGLMWAFATVSVIVLVLLFVLRAVAGLFWEL
jgi:hypothetical protein